MKKNKKQKKVFKILPDADICTPLGFKTNALNCGIKNNKLDLALIYSIVKADAAAVFTMNKVKAAPVLIAQKHLEDNKAQAIIINSGNANCCTGKKGYDLAVKVIRSLADTLEIDSYDVLMSSTGVIGKYLPADKIIASIKPLVSGLEFDKAADTAKAMMTTDSFAKTAAVSLKVGTKTVTIAGVAKGAGMIEPNMATMLCFITTDANINAAALKKSLKIAVDNSFNCITVDGDMSTNDTVCVLANGLADNKKISTSGKDFDAFTSALQYICHELALMVVKDGEGATKIIQVNIESAKTKEQAKQAAYRIANSLLVKTMIAGENPNWGRLPASIGASEAEFDHDKLEVYLQGVAVYRKQTPDTKSREKLIKLLSKDRVDITIKLNSGKFSHTVWSNDLTEEYVKINTEYN